MLENKSTIFNKTVPPRMEERTVNAADKTRLPKQQRQHTMVLMPTMISAIYYRNSYVSQQIHHPSNSTLIHVACSLLGVSDLTINIDDTLRFLLYTMLTTTVNDSISRLG